MWPPSASVVEKPNVNTTHKLVIMRNVTLRVCLNLLSSIFSAGQGGFGQRMYRSPERSPQDSRDGIFCTVPRPHFLGRALIWPDCFEHILGLFGLYPSSQSKSVGFVSVPGKASLVFISAAILFVRISWKKLCWNKSMSAKMASRVSYLVYYYCIQSEFEQITANYHETSLEQ